MNSVPKQSVAGGKGRRVINDFLSRVEARLGTGKPRSWPVELTIEPTNRCNSRCAMCLPYRRDLRLDPPPMGFMDRSTLERLEKALHKCRKVLLTGCGEPLLHPEFISMAGWVKARVPYVYIFTNGSLIDESMARCLVQSGLDLVSISLGGATEETSGKVRGLPLRRALDGLEALARARKDAGSDRPVIQFSIVAMNTVLPELPQVIEIARSHGVESISLPPLLAHNPGMEAESLLVNPASGALLDEAKRLARKAGVNLTVWDYPPQPGACTAVYRGLFVAFNGDVLSCSAERHVMGNVNEQPVERIWRSKAFRTLRRMVRAVPGEICPGCPVWSGSPEAYLRAHAHDRRRAGSFDAAGRPLPPAKES